MVRFWRVKIFCRRPMLTRWYRKNRKFLSAIQGGLMKYPKSCHYFLDNKTFELHWVRHTNPLLEIPVRMERGAAYFASLQTMKKQRLFLPDRSKNMSFLERVRKSLWNFLFRWSAHYSKEFLLLEPSCLDQHRTFLVPLSIRTSSCVDETLFSWIKCLASKLSCLLRTDGIRYF